MASKKSKRVSFRVEEYIFSNLNDIAESFGVSSAELNRMIMDEFLRDEKFQELITASEEETATPRRIFGFDPAFKWEVPSEITSVTIIGEYLSYVHLHSDVCHRNMNLLFTQYRRCSTCYGSCR